MLPVLLGTWAAAAGGAWPADSAWTAVTRDGEALVDVCGDAEGRTAWDLVGQDGVSAAAIALQQGVLHVRVRLADDPTRAEGGVTAWDDGGVAVLLETEWREDDPTWDLAVFLDGRTGEVTLWENR